MSEPCIKDLMPFLKNTNRAKEVLAGETKKEEPGVVDDTRVAATDPDVDYIFRKITGALPERGPGWAMDLAERYIQAQRSGDYTYCRRLDQELTMLARQRDYEQEIVRRSETENMVSRPDPYIARMERRYYGSH